MRPSVNWCLCVQCLWIGKRSVACTKHCRSICGPRWVAAVNFQKATTLGVTRRRKSSSDDTSQCAYFRWLTIDRAALEFVAERKREDAVRTMIVILRWMMMMILMRIKAKPSHSLVVRAVGNASTMRRQEREAGNDCEFLLRHHHHHHHRRIGIRL